MFRIAQLLVSVLFTLHLVTAAAFAADATEFVALGDMPYSQDQFKSLGIIGEKIQHNGFPFVVHYGDVISGRTKCEDQALGKSKKAIYGLLKGRVFYTPGDNDWTDCDRGGFDEMKRLVRLREIFYGDENLPSADAWRIDRQKPGYPENARWYYDDVAFVTLHIVGTDNGRDDINKSNEDEALKAVADRDRANLMWLNKAFDKAGAYGAQALVAFIHADPYDIEHEDQRSQECTAQQPVLCNPYRAFLKHLARRANAFDKPVLLVHGSTSLFCLDTGFGGLDAPKLWRFNGPGDYVHIDAAVVRFERDANTPFQVRGLLSGNLPPECSLE